MLTVFVIFIFASHLIAAIPFAIALWRHQLPKVVDFACVSMVVYYDTGLVLETFVGMRPPDGFPSLLETAPWVQTTALCLVLVAPWLLRGTLPFSPDPDRIEITPSLRLRRSRRVLFFAAAFVFSGAVGLYGLIILRSGLAIWVLRSEIGTRFGPLIILLYLPMYLLAYLLTLEEARTRVGLALTVWLVASSILGTMAMGQRTLLLVPILMVGLFRGTPSLRRLVPLVAAGVLAAALLLPTFKWQYESTSATPEGLIVDVLQGDFSRSYILAESIDRASLLGTRLLAYPLAGYVYAGLFFVPRTVAPFKGESTATMFTAAVTHQPPETLGWAYGIGFIEESVLNAGLLLAPLVMALYGALYRKLDRLGHTRPGLGVAARLAALWSCGYDSPALLLTFGGSAVLGLALNWLFAEPALAPRAA